MSILARHFRRHFMTTTTASASVVSPVSITRHALRILLGLLFLVPSASFFLGLLPAPTDPTPANVAAFTGGLMAAGYMFPLIKGTELLAALLLLSNRFVPLALVLLAPVVVNIVLFHAFLAPSGLPVAVAALALELGLAWLHRDTYAPLLAAVRK